MKYIALKENADFWKEGDEIPEEVLIQWFTPVGIGRLIESKVIKKKVTFNI